MKLKCKAYDCINRYQYCESCICNENSLPDSEGGLYDSYEPIEKEDD